jgi:hypothetical protein
MIEGLVIEHQPSAGSVAALALTSEPRLVRVAMAVIATLKGQPDQARESLLTDRLRIPFLGMTLLADNGLVQPGQGESGLLMVETHQRFPDSLVVASHAGSPLELSPMLVLMTGKTV